jgi:hypothetical protein
MAGSFIDAGHGNELIQVHGVPGCYYRPAGTCSIVPVAIQNPSGTEEQT